MSTYDYGWRPYVPVATRRRNAEREAAKRRKAGQAMAPVTIEGRTIARTFWGKAWCENLERYSDYANRLPRGRTYVRNGSVIDLQVSPGRVNALVYGSALYKVEVQITAVPSTKWAAICADCAGAVDSLVELLQGRLSKGVMERVTRQGAGLFPSPSEIKLSCSCPDWASMCKHVAAVLYGVGARLDERPELLFRLRGVDETELVAQASAGLPLAKGGPAADRVLETEDLSALFGLELAEGEAPVVAVSKPEAPAPGAKAAQPAAPKSAKKASKPKPAALSASERAEIQEAIAGVEARVAALRQEGGKAAARTIATYEDWLEKNRARLGGG